MEPYVRTLGVHLLDLPRHLDIEYTYYIPDTMEEEIPAGAFVLVPFGGANKKMTALVSSVSLTEDHSKLKPILAVINEQLTLDDRMMRLVHFLCERSLCSFGDAVRRLIPAAAFERANEIYFPLGDAASSEMLTPRTAPVYEAILTHAPMRAERLTKLFGAEVRPLLRRLVQGGLIGTDTVIRESEGAHREIAVFDPDADAMVLSKPRTPEAHRLLYAEIAEHGRISVHALTDAGYSAAHIKALEKKGLIHIEKEEHIRNPYAQMASSQTPAPIVLSEEQNAAYERLSSLLMDEAPHAALLYGVTGSGKTNVILSLCQKAIDSGKQAIVLIPEIALTWQSVTAFTSRFGGRVAVIHSALSDGERFDAYKRIRRGEVDIVLGTRSAIFAPIERLGLIVIDEEQESAYKSDMSPKYHARDIAKFRAAEAGALLVMASATPSLESYNEATKGKYELITLTKRYHGESLPRVKIADMRSETAGEAIIGRELRALIGETLKNGKQAMLFLNRRGFNSVLSCHACGEAVLCPHCSVSLTHHKSKFGGSLVCHYCGHRIPIPKFCPSCGSEHISFGGYGTQRIEEELHSLFPSARIMRMDADTTREKFSRDELTERFAKGEADILVGTQMIAKGHNFPNLALVGVVAADNSLFLDDFRANERTFSLITQVIGRAGRADGGGIAVIQTYNPDNETIRLSAKQDYQAFFQNELAVRRALVFPPFCDIAVFSFVSEEEDALRRFAEEFTRELDRMGKNDPHAKLLLYGPFEASIYKMKNKYRLRTVVKFKNNRHARALFAEMLCTFGKKAQGKITLGVDINPSST